MDATHRAFCLLASTLEERGVESAEIAAVLLVLGIEGGIEIAGRKEMADYLEKVAQQVRAGEAVTGRVH